MNNIDLQVMATIGPAIIKALENKEAAELKIEFYCMFDSFEVGCILEVVHGKIFISGNFDWNPEVYNNLRSSKGRGFRQVVTSEGPEKIELEDIPLSQFIAMICKYRMMIETWF